MYNRKAVALFDGWDEAMIWSCLHGCMGELITESDENPASAMIAIRDFYFLAGRPNAALLRTITGEKLLIPKDIAWGKLIEGVFEERAKKILRYAIKKEPNVFDRVKLASYIHTLGSGYELRRFDSQIFSFARNQRWSADLCAQFKDDTDDQCRALGTAILFHGELVAGASPYAVYHGGIEIEIDTKPSFRRKGLATICGAKLILDCLDRNLYPSWDAHDLRSVALAEKLGYHLSHSYAAYELNGQAAK